MKMANQLYFEMFDPVEANEYWAVTFGSYHKVVEAYIDGKPLLDRIREKEAPYVETEKLYYRWADYGHVSPRSLYDDLIEATVENSFSYKLGTYPFCCAGCGERGCWSVTFRVREDEHFVYWYDFRHEHRRWKYDLTFQFEKGLYRDALEQLKYMAEHQDCVSGGNGYRE